MVKPTPYWVTLNQAPRSAKHHGKHRRAGAPAHGSPVIGADHSAGDQSFQVVSWNTGWATISDPVTIDFAVREPDPPAVPYAGIRAGELIGHRLWWLVEGQLCSLAHRRLWKPGETITGATNKVVSDWASFFGPTIWGGTYAFFSAEQMGGEIKDCLEAIETSAEDRQRLGGMGGLLHQLFWRGSIESVAVVAGTIKMWGEVVEHERGYRAEFAKLNSIDAVYGEGDLDALRARYGVGAAN